MVTALSTVQPLAQFHSHTSPVAYRPGTGSKVTSPLPELASLRASPFVLILTPPMVIDVLTVTGAA